MFNWLKKLFGFDVPDTPVIAQVKVEDKVETSTPTKAKKPAKKDNVDLDAMSKNDLLAHAKANGIKANASMKKADLVSAIKNG